jgi:hypothetical protein
VPTVPILNIFFVVIPIVIFVYSIVLYVLKSRHHDNKRKNANLFHEIHPDGETVETPHTGEIEVDHEDIHESSVSKDKLLHDHEEFHKKHSRKFLESIQFMTTEMRDHLLQCLHPQESLLWADVPYYQISNNGKLRSLLGTTCIVFVINVLFICISGFVVLPSNAL